MHASCQHLGAEYPRKERNIHRNTVTLRYAVTPITGYAVTPLAPRMTTLPRGTRDAIRSGMSKHTADDLIARSVSHTEIVTAEWSEDLAEQLSAESDDSVDASDTVVEYWGTTESGAEWRVHLHGTRD